MDNINFVLTKKYQLHAAAVEAAEKIGMSLTTEDNTFTVTEVTSGGMLVFSNDIQYHKVAGHSAPPPPHPEYGSPIHPDLHEFCTLVDE